MNAVSTRTLALTVGQVSSPVGRQVHVSVRTSNPSTDMGDRPGTLGQHGVLAGTVHEGLEWTRSLGRPDIDLTGSERLVEPQICVL